MTKSLVEKAKKKALEDFVDKFLTSSNFGDSTNILRALGNYEAGTIPAKLINKIAENWDKNDQIKGCGGIPRRMENFLHKHGYKKPSSDIPF